MAAVAVGKEAQAVARIGLHRDPFLEELDIPPLLLNGNRCRLVTFDAGGKRCQRVTPIGA